MKVILDFVPNYTSDEHPWFQEARASRENAKRDWYIWRNPAPDGGPPNNWTSLFGGSAWQFDTQTGQYYLHLFDVKQPDLNWRNPDVQQAMFDVMRFWLDRGIDGFRVDVLWMLIKDDQFRDNVMNPDWKPGDPPFARQIGTYTEDQPGIHEIVRKMRSVLDSYGERVFIGEIYLSISRLIDYYGEMLDEAHLPFNFQFVTLSNWHAQTIRQIVDEYEMTLPDGAWPNWVLGNHDRARIATRVGRKQARVAKMLLLTLRGTPTCYYGDELGMQDGNVPLELMRDPQGKQNPEHSRDPIRTPMQWDSGLNAGFCPAVVTPWLPLADDYQAYNVASEQNDPHSFLTLTRRLLEIRRSLPAFTIGSYRSIDQDNASCFVYQRQHEGHRYLVVLNISDQEQTVTLPGVGQGRIALSTQLDRDGTLNLSSFVLRANEGYLIEIVLCQS